MLSPLTRGVQHGRIQQTPSPVSRPPTRPLSMEKDTRPAQVSGHGNPREPKMMMAHAFARMVDVCGKRLYLIDLQSKYSMFNQNISSITFNIHFPNTLE